MPSATRSVEEQQDLNQHLIAASFDNQPDLVLHYLSQGADPSSHVEVAYELLPDSDIPQKRQTAENRIAPENVKFSASEENTTEPIFVLHAAIINCCKKTSPASSPYVVAGASDSSKSAASKAAQIVKALVEAGANSTRRSTFMACNIPGYVRHFLPMVKVTPLDFALRLQIVLKEKVDLVSAQDFQFVVDVLEASAVSKDTGDNWLATIDRESQSSIHISTLGSFRNMLNSASESFSDIVFECAAETAPSLSDFGASNDSSLDASVEADRGMNPKRLKKADVPSSSSSFSCDQTSLDPSNGSSAPPNSLILAHRCILSASSPYFRTLFSGAWRDISDGRIIAKQGERAIRRMLEFIYTGEMTAVQALQLPFEDLAELHEASAEYQIDALRVMTEAALAQNVSAFNLVRMLQLASLHDGTSCMPVFAPAVSITSPLSSISSTSSSLMAPCMLLNACVAILKEDITLFTSDEVVEFLAGKPNLRTSLRAALGKKA